MQTLDLQISYDTKLNNATYDALKAFQINTINSSTSDLANSKLRDIEASVNTFFNSITSNFNMAGYNRDILKEYVPALVYTMYDGYYIYSPFINNLPAEDEGTTYTNGEKISDLKPYIHYSVRYQKTGIDVIITYSLDNYITVQGIVNGEGINKSGYLLDNISDITTDAQSRPTSVKYRETTINAEDMLTEYIGDNKDPNNLYQYIKINGVKYYRYKPAIDGKDGWFTVLNGEKYGGQPDFNYRSGKDYSAVQYYAEAKTFTDYIRSKLGGLTTADAVDDNGNHSLSEQFGNIPIFSGGSSSIEEPNSNFNQHRLAVIRYTIEKNLSVAIANYNNYQGQGKANFAMPTLTETEWEKILNNISIISFLQGLNIGGKIYNGYSIITNTKNKEAVTEDSIYITTTDNEYHSVKETGLNLRTDLNNGILNIDFERVSNLDENGKAEYFYPQTQLGSYLSIVTQTSISDVEDIYQYLSDKANLQKIYYTALGRERQSMNRTNANTEEIIKNAT